MALIAKTYGFDVTAGDASAIGQAVARGLVANSGTRLQPHHLLALLREEVAVDGPAQLYVPRVFTTSQASWLDRALAARERFNDPTRALLELVIIRTALRLQPMSGLDATDARYLATGDLDRISSRRLGHYLNTDRALELPALERLARDINAGVIGGTGHARCGDARDVIGMSEADVVYLDPPVPGHHRLPRSVSTVACAAGRRDDRGCAHAGRAARCRRPHPPRRHLLRRPRSHPRIPR